LGGVGKWVIIGLSLFTVYSLQFTVHCYGEEIRKEDSKEGISKRPDREAPIIIEADRIEYHKDVDTYEAWGSVRIIQDKAHLESDYATLDNRSGDALALGNVWYDDGESILIAERLELNLNTKLGIIYKGRIFHRPDNYHIEGEEMEKTGEDIYQIKKGSFTTCDALVPPWRFRGRDVKVYLNDNISARDVVFYIKDKPLLYTPYLRVPIKKERHSGFLFPRIGHSDQKGYILQNAFYWAMADNMDSTFYLDYRSKIGFGVGLEYRYILSKDVRGDFYNYYLKDKEIGKDFWELRFNHDHQITKTLLGKANIIYLSEPTYYQRFSTLTEERIQRGIESNLLLSQNWSTSRLYILNQYRQDLTTPSNAGTLQKLPEIGYVLTNYKMGGLPLYLGFESTAINFWRETGEKGQRLNIYPQISSTLNLGRGFAFSPRGGFRETAYIFQGDTLHREIYNLGATLGTKIFRVFDVEVGEMNKIKHSIEPSVSYDFIPDVDQKDLPQFDSLDFIPKTNIVSYSLINRLIGRFSSEGKKRTFEFLTLKLSQSYNLDKDVEKPFSDVIMEATLRSPKLFSFNTSSSYNPYSGYLTTFNSSLTIRGDTPWYISIDKRYTKSPESLFFTAEGSAKVSKSLDLLGKIWYDATQEKIMEVGLRGTYSSQCWALNLIYIGRPEEKETQVLISIDLKGLGTLKLASFSQRGI
jgi:LPS-assembly protein